MFARFWAGFEPAHTARLSGYRLRRYASWRPATASQRRAVCTSLHRNTPCGAARASMPTELLARDPFIARSRSLFQIRRFITNPCAHAHRSFYAYHSHWHLSDLRNCGIFPIPHLPCLRLGRTLRTLSRTGRSHSRIRIGEHRFLLPNGRRISLYG